MAVEDVCSRDGDRLCTVGLVLCTVASLTNAVPGAGEPRHEDGWAPRRSHLRPCGISGEHK